MALRFPDGAGAIDHVIGKAAFFVEGKLRSDTALGLFEREATIQQSRDLLLARAPCDGEAIERFVVTAFDVQRGDHYSDSRTVSLSDIRKLAGDLFEHRRMGQRVEAHELFGISKYDFAEPGTVDCAVCIENLRAKLGDDLLRYRI